MNIKVKKFVEEAIQRVFSFCVLILLFKDVVDSLKNTRIVLISITLAYELNFKHCVQKVK